MFERRPPSYGYSKLNFLLFSIRRFTILINTNLLPLTQKPQYVFTNDDPIPQASEPFSQTVEFANLINRFILVLLDIEFEINDMLEVLSK